MWETWFRFSSNLVPRELRRLGYLRRSTYYRKCFAPEINRSLTRRCDPIALPTIQPLFAGIAAWEKDEDRLSFASKIRRTSYPPHVVLVQLEQRFSMARTPHVHPHTQLFLSLNRQRERQKRPPAFGPKIDRFSKRCLVRFRGVVMSLIECELELQFEVVKLT